MFEKPFTKKSYHSWTSTAVASFQLWFGPGFKPLSKGQNQRQETFLSYSSNERFESSNRVLWMHPIWPWKLITCLWKLKNHLFLWIDLLRIGCSHCYTIKIWLKLYVFVMYIWTKLLYSLVALLLSRTPHIYTYFLKVYICGFRNLVCMILFYDKDG